MVIPTIPNGSTALGAGAAAASASLVLRRDRNPPEATSAVGAAAAGPRFSRLARREGALLGTPVVKALA